MQLLFIYILACCVVSSIERLALEGDLNLDPCSQFVEGDPSKMEFYSPNYPNNYPNHTDCIKVLEAEPGHLLRLDFRDHFDLEGGEECRFDYLEVRDGAHGYSELLGQFCGHGFPPELASTTRFLWLRFHSDENIEYRGFRAVYTQLPKPTSEAVVPEMEDCRMEIRGMEGYVNRSDIDPEHTRLSAQHDVPLDCMWVITVQEGWRIQLNFNKFALAVPNDCDSNFVDIFAERTDLPSRLHNFCGSIAELVLSPANVLRVRFLAAPSALTSNFEALFTAFRDKPKGLSCEPDEYDCEDGNCISIALKCNGRINCRFRWDEDQNECAHKQGVLSAILNAEHMIIILVVFFLILTGMCFAFLFNCFRKLLRDHRTIQEQMRASREARLEVLAGGGVGVGAKKELPPWSGSCHVPGGGGGGGDGELDEGDDSVPEMVDSQCQTRESLFTPPPPPPPGFTTFGYSSSGESALSEAALRATSMDSTKSAPDVIMTH